MKKMSQRKRLNRTLKIADIDDDMTNFRALPEPVLAGRQEKGAVVPFLLRQDNP